MFRTRLLSGIVLMAGTIALLVYGGFPLFWAITLLSVLGLFELYRAAGIEKKALAFIGYLSSVIIDILLLDELYEMLLMWLILTMLVWLAGYVIVWPRYTVQQMTVLLFGLLYVTVFLSFVFKTRYLENGILYVWLIYISAWGCDTSAYCVGKLCGRHKLPSALSPNKTVEGCVGGILGAALLGLLFACIFFSGEAGMVWKLPLVTGICSVFSQIGDLTASAIKRNYGIKDYGKLIPGHGGILDRFDSILFIAPVIYYLVKLL